MHGRSFPRGGRPALLALLLVQVASAAHAAPPGPAVALPLKRSTLAAHSDFVSGLAFSPEGERLISASADKTIAVFDTKTGKELARRKDHPDAIFALACSPTGNEAFVAGGKFEGASPAALSKIDIAAKRLVTGLREGALLEAYTGHDAAVVSMALSFDGATLATGDLTSVVRFWKTGTGSAGHMDANDANLVNDIENLTKSTDALIAKINAKEKGQTGPVNLPESAPLAELRVPGPALALAFSSDQKYLAVAPGDNTVLLYDAATRELTRKLEGHQGKVLALAFRHGTHQLASGSADKTVKLWDADAGAVLQTFAGSEGAVFALAFLADGHRLASGGKDSQVRVWDLATAKLSYALPEPTGYVRSLAVDRGGRMLAAGTKSGTISLYRLPFGRDLEAAAAVFTSSAKNAYGTQLVVDTGEHTDRVSQVLFTKDGKQIITGSWDKTVRVWDSASGEMLRTIRLPAYSGSQGTVYAMALSPNEKLLAVAGASVEAELKTVNGKGEYITMINLETGEIADVIGHHLNVIFALGFAPDGRSIATGAGDNDQKSLIYSVAPDGKMALVTGAMLPSMVLGAKFSADGRHVFLIDAVGDLVRITPAEISTSPLKRSSREALPEALTLADGSEAKQCSGMLIDKSTRRRMSEMTGQEPNREAGFYGLAVDPTGQWVAAGDALGVVTLTPANRGLPDAPEVETRYLLKHDEEHPGTAGALAFSRDGKLFAAGVGKTVKVIEVATQKMLTVFEQHTNSVFAVDFSPDGKRVVSTNGNGSATLVWETATGKVLARLGGRQTLPKIWSLGSSLKNPGVLGIGNSDSGEEINDYGPIQYGFDFTSLRILPSVDPKDFLTGKQSNERAHAGTPEFVPNPQTVGLKMLSWLALPNGRAVIGTEYGAHYQDPYMKPVDQSGLRGNALALGSDAGQTFYLGLDDGRIEIFDTAAMKLLATLLVTAEHEWVLFTPDGYYAASKSGAKSVGWLMNHGVTVNPGYYPFEQFDLRLNRPDLVLGRLGYPGITPATLQALKSAREKRLRKMGIDDSALASDATAPKLVIARTAEVSKAKKIELEISVTSAGVPLDRLNVYANDVPIFGAAGMSVKAEKASSLKRKIAIELTSGRNKLQVSALDIHGAESAKETVYVTYTGAARQPDLYVLGIGVSDYNDAQWKLDYAAKDASDLAAALRKNSAGFGKVQVQTLLDKAVTKEAVAEAKKFLQKTHTDDQVVLFIAGHGLLDEKDDYYFGTADISFTEPAARGLPYDAIEGLLDGIPARRKLLLMDTCHSGEVDKESLPPLVASTADGKVSARVPGTRGLRRQGTEGVTSDALNGVLGSLFTDLRRGSGAMVISSASGQQLSIEGDKFHNGVFTYALLQGLESREADTNHDGAVKVGELRDYVIQKVTQLTQGQQTPTSRRENLDFDFNVIQYDPKASAK